MKKNLITWTIPVLLAVGVLAAGTLPGRPDRHEYALIDGPEYRLVTLAEFERARATCVRLATRTYPALRLVQDQCER